MVAVEAVAAVDSAEEAETEVAVVALVEEVVVVVEEEEEIEVEEGVVEDEAVEEEEQEEVLELKELKSSLNHMRDSQEYSFLEAKMISLLLLIVYQARVSMVSNV